MNAKIIVLKLANHSVLKIDHQAAPYNRKYFSNHCNDILLCCWGNVWNSYHIRVLATSSFFRLLSPSWGLFLLSWRHGRERLLFECQRVSSVWVPENLCYIVWGQRIRKTQEVWMDQLDTDLTRHRGSNRLAYRNNISRQIVPL